jgi:hypothetical protein
MATAYKLSVQSPPALNLPLHNVSPVDQFLQPTTLDAYRLSKYQLCSSNRSWIFINDQEREAQLLRLFIKLLIPFHPIAGCGNQQNPKAKRLQSLKRETKIQHVHEARKKKEMKQKAQARKPPIFEIKAVYVGNVSTPFDTWSLDPCKIFSLYPRSLKNVLRMSSPNVVLLWTLKFVAVEEKF